MFFSKVNISGRAVCWISSLRSIVIRFTCISTRDCRNLWIYCYLLGSENSYLKRRWIWSKIRCYHPLLIWNRSSAIIIWSEHDATLACPVWRMVAKSIVEKSDTILTQILHGQTQSSNSESKCYSFYVHTCMYICVFFFLCLWRHNFSYLH